jgi:flagella basal body P-ring formation protein FlgA
MIVRNESLQKKPVLHKTLPPWLGAIALGCAFVASPASTAATSIADVRAAAEQHVLSRLQESTLLNDAQEYTVEVGQLDSRIQVANCDQPLQTAVHGQWPSSQPLVKVSCAGNATWTMYVPVTVSVFHMVATTASAVERGQVLDGSNIALQKQNIMATHGRYYRSVDEAAGQIAKRHLSPGELLGSHNLDMPKAIKRGDEVVISASSGPIAVKMPAVAMSDGRVGQRISVKNSSSQRIIQATVTGPGQVATAM